MKQILSFLLFLLPALAFAQWPAAPNKIRLGNQTTGDGLIYRSDSLPDYTPTSRNNAWLHFDTVAKKLYFYEGGTWQEYASGGGGADDWGSQVVEKDSTLRGNGTLADPLRVNRDTFATRAEVAQALADSVAARPTGTGTTNALAKWLSSTSLGNSLMSDDGSRITAGGTAGLVLPSGTTAQRSGTPVVGEMRRNTTTGYAESYDGTTWRQADFPTTATTSASLRYNGTNWEASSVLRIHGNGITLGSTGNTTSPLTIKRGDFSTNNLINFNLSGTDEGLLSWDSGSTSSYSIGKNYSGFFQILEGSSNNTGLVYNRETNGVNINNTFASKSTFYVKYRTPDHGGHTTSVYIEGSATGNTFRIESNGNVGIMTGASTPSNTLHVVGTARVTGSSTLPAASVTGRDSLGVFRDVTIGSGLSFSEGTLSATGPAAKKAITLYSITQTRDSVDSTPVHVQLTNVPASQGSWTYTDSTVTLTTGIYKVSFCTETKLTPQGVTPAGLYQLAVYTGETPRAWLSMTTIFDDDVNARFHLSATGLLNIEGTQTLSLRQTVSGATIDAQAYHELISLTIQEL